MFPKINPEPVHINFKGNILKIPRNMLASAWAGAIAAKECLLWNDLYAFPFKTSFKEQYIKAMPGCINAANATGLSATIETLEYYNPGKGTNSALEFELN